jgi:endo-1,4-beta-mannosidase
MTRFSLGVNYWPRSSAMAMWQRFDRGEIAEDFARIAALGLDAVRFFLRWDAFAPAADRIDEAMVGRFVEVLDIAHAAGLTTMPTLFCGHMSGVNWLPSWSLDPVLRTSRFRTITEHGESPYAIGDFYTDPMLLDAQRRFARAVAEAAREHPAILTWDLGNEFSNLREPASAADAALWSGVLTENLRGISGHPVTAGTHGEDLTFDRRIRLRSLCESFDFATMHGYSVYSAFARDRLDAEVVPFLSELAASFAHKRVLFSEFGNPACPPDLAIGEQPPIACLNEDEMAAYAREVLDRLHHGGALGAYWWCWTDYAPELAAEPPFDRAPHEFRFGLLRADGSEKPVARTLAAFAGEKRAVLAHTPAMPLDEEAYYAGLPETTAAAFRLYCKART